MKKIISTLFSILLTTNLLNAEDINTTKSEKQFTSDEEFFRKMAELDQQVSDKKENRAELIKRQNEAKAKTAAKEAKLKQYIITPPSNNLNLKSQAQAA